MLINGSQLLEALAAATKLTDDDSATVRISAHDCFFFMHARGPASSLRIQIECNGQLAPCRVEGRRLRTFLRTALKSDRTCAIEVSDRVPGRLQIACGNTAGDFRVEDGTDVEEDDAPTEIDHCAVDVDALYERLAWVNLAASTDETRVALIGVRFDSDSGSIAASDGHRLHIAQVAGLRGLPFTARNVEVDALLVLLANGRGGKVQISVGTRHVRFSSPSFDLVAPLKEEVFPPFHQVVPARDGQTFGFLVDTKNVKSATASVRGHRRGRAACKLVMNGAVALSSSSDDSSETSTVDVSVADNTHQGDLTTVGVDARYLADAVSARGSRRVGMSFRGPLDPILVEYLDGTMTAVVMPMRV